MRARTWGFWLVLLLALLGALVVTAPAAAGSSDFVRVKVDTANIREGPGTQFELADEVYENDPLQVIGRKGRWLKTRDFEGDQGWIYAPLTDDKPAAIVKAKWVNVRSGPGTNHPVVFTAERGVSFRVVEEHGDWLEVQHADGDRGFVYESLIWGSW